MYSEYEELIMKKEKLEIEFGNIVEGHTHKQCMKIKIMRFMQVNKEKMKYEVSWVKSTIDLKK